MFGIIELEAKSFHDERLYYTNVYPIEINRRI